MAKARKLAVPTKEVKLTLDPQKKVNPKRVEQLANAVSNVQDRGVLDIKYMKGKDSFNFLAGINRAVKPSHVTKICKSLNKMGNVNPITVASLSFLNGKKMMYIIDGQHRFTGLIRLGWSIPYIVIDIKDKQDLVEHIALLNASSKSWCVQDYVNAWASLKEDYVKLNRYFEIYDFELSILASILSGNSVNTITKKIKAGEFKIVSENKKVQILDHLTDALDIVPRMGRIENKYFCKEFVDYVQSKGCEYDHKRAMAFLRKNKDKFVLATQEEGKVKEMLGKI